MIQETLWPGLQVVDIIFAHMPWALNNFERMHLSFVLRRIEQNWRTPNQSVTQIPFLSGHQISISILLPQYLLVMSSSAKSCFSGQSIVLSPKLGIANLVATTYEQKRQVIICTKLSSFAHSYTVGEERQDNCKKDFHLKTRRRIRE